MNIANEQRQCPNWNNPRWQDNPSETHHNDKTSCEIPYTHDFLSCRIILNLPHFKTVWQRTRRLLIKVFHQKYNLRRFWKGDPTSPGISHHHFKYQCWFYTAPSQWETSLQSNAVSHWLRANLESTLSINIFVGFVSIQTSSRITESNEALPTLCSSSLLTTQGSTQWRQLNARGRNATFLMQRRTSTSRPFTTPWRKSRTCKNVPRLSQDLSFRDPFPLAFQAVTSLQLFERN